MTTAVATNFQVIQFETFKTTDIPPDCVEGLSAEQVEATLKLARDGTLWNSMEDFKCAKADAIGKKTKVIGGSTFIIVNPNDPHIIALGKYAVTEHNKQAGTNLAFKQVLCGLQSPVGIIYALIIRVQDGETIRDCGALIVEALWFKKLLAWVNLPPYLLK